MTTETVTVIIANSLALTVPCPNCGYNAPVPAGAVHLEAIDPYATAEPYATEAKPAPEVAQELTPPPQEAEAPEKISV